MNGPLRLVLLHLPVAILLILLAGIRLAIALHVAVALGVRGTIPIAALAARPLARLLILIAALSGAHISSIMRRRNGLMLLPFIGMLLS